MSEVSELRRERVSETEMPAGASLPTNEDTVFPPFPDPTDEDFDDDIQEEEKSYYIKKFSDVKTIKSQKLHCTACDRHLGCAARNESRMRIHPMLRTLICQTCHTFYNSGEFDKGDDGSELYCRWCGQGGQVYCCSDCPHVFCAKCIKRNLGVAKIKEIESTDDWKCFKCTPKCLWDLRALCWALLRYCDLKNKITHKTVDARLKEAYKQDCNIDYSECCKNSKRARTQKKKEVKKETDIAPKKSVSPATIISKMPPTIQVKKFASVFADDQKSEKKAQKRTYEKPNIIRTPIPIAPVSQFFNQPLPSMNVAPKRPRMITPSNSNNTTPTPIKFDRPVRTYNPPLRFSPRPYMPMLTFNGLANSYNQIMHSDNINLSLDSLTQGLDMAAVHSLNNDTLNDDLVCTPDLPPLEPLCEVTEDNTDDDVQCMTPAPLAVPKTPQPQARKSLPDISSDNIIQMTENDVTVNKLTGGLKFRVDPQTLSSNKMYRLPDGRVFAITANPNMPAGYSATIVAVTETNKVGAKGATYNAKVSAPKPADSPKPRKRSINSSKLTIKENSKTKKKNNNSNRSCDLDVPIEWYRYNLVDAIHALDYSSLRLNKLKKEATTVFLRTRTVEEMKTLHKRLNNVLDTSITRFNEIKEHIDNDFKAYVIKKMGNFTSEDEIEEDDDDDVEILPNNDDPIFIDENSVDSIVSGTVVKNNDVNNPISRENNESTADKVESEMYKDESNLNVSTTVINSSKSSNDSAEVDGDNKERNNSEKTSGDKNIINHNSENEPSNENESVHYTAEREQIKETNYRTDEKSQSNDQNKDMQTIEKDHDSQDITVKYIAEELDEELLASELEISNKTVECEPDKTKIDVSSKSESELPDESDKDELIQSEKDLEKVGDTHMEVDDQKEKAEITDGDKIQDTEMSEELIEDLLKDDNCDETVTSMTNSLDIGDIVGV